MMKKLIEFVSIFSKVVGYKIHIQKPIVFLYSSNEQLTKFKMISYSNTPKHEITVK